MEIQKSSAHTYCIIFDWAFDNEHDVEVKAFNDESEAREVFKQLVEKEKQESWIAVEKELAADDDSEPTEGSLVIEDDSDTYFYAYIQGWESSQYTSIKLTVL